MTLKRQIFTLLRRVPWLAPLLTAAYRLTRPRVTAGVVGVIKNEKNEVLLAEHVLHPSAPWGLPGGWSNRNETPRDTLTRELQEELGLEVTIIRPLLVEQDRRRGHLDIAYLCKANGRVKQLSAELLDYRWTTPDNLPTLLPFHAAAIREARIQPDNEE